MLRKLHVNNYRCLRDFTLELDQVTLLLGYNGSGKSSVFDVLAAVRGLVTLGRRVSEAFPGTTLATGPDRDQQVEMTLVSPMGELSYRLEIEHRSPGARIRSEVVRVVDGAELLNAGRGEAFVQRRLADPLLFSSLAPDLSVLSVLERDLLAPELAWFLTFLEGMWVVRPNPQAMEGAGRENRETLEDLGTEFPAWCRHLVTANHPVIDDAAPFLQAVIPDFEALSADQAGRMNVLLVEFLTSAEHRYDLEFDLLSDGQKVLVLLYVLLAAIPTIGATLVALDEPDNWVSLREIQPFLVELATRTEDAGAQTLIASHNPEVIDFIGPGHAIILERGEGATRVTRPGTDPDLKLSELLARGWDAAK